MPVLKSPDYKAPILLRNRHLLTIFPSLFRKIKPADYTRTRIPTHDNDFLDLDFSKVGSDQLVIMLHGLEGDSRRQYITGMVHIFNEGGYDTVSMNFRGCSGESNKALRFYHSGETGDLHTVIQHMAATGDYKRIHLIGFSLGGNVTLKYLGEQGDTIPAIVRSAVAISVPCDLKDSSIELEKRHNFIYMKRFIRSLGLKLERKAKLYPKEISLANFGTIKNFKQFDDRYTAPMHGFKDAEEYWAKNSSKQFLENIRIPTLLINALDDPFLGKGSFPYKEADNNPHLYLETPETGGHVGFVTFTGKHYWSERRAFQFIHDHP
ncbi:alpha/beta fold hydrolase [Chitinophaga sp. SYP-B3965]|uniref:YheT family hydrolase n=1 Tax=Chitinophaga sp. SYP-B3965 TaxID=2663120 RepID=UPI001299BB01|nr:alpha/beta fold hydrolase [Chitinophaga sp. SYP-B3965]MRG48953.1 alpha/beta fold hydrolase [Chitinophaga sp. SYP-B3965]